MSIRFGIVLALVAAASAARAHDLTREELVNGKSAVLLRHYPVETIPTRWAAAGSART